MEFFPFFRRPYYYPQGRYIRNPYGTYEMPNINEENRYNQNFKKQEQYDFKKEEKRDNENTRKSQDGPVFDIFGIKLYFDDILLISLIFFLYNEGVRDNMLFISLILLLLS